MLHNYTNLAMTRDPLDPVYFFPFSALVFHTSMAGLSVLNTGINSDNSAKQIEL